MAGYFGGWLDDLIMRVTDIFLAFPALLLALALAAVLPPSLTSVTIAISVTWWPWYTRLIRGQAAAVAGRPYIESCRALGISRWRIIFRHILPNAITPLIVQISLDVGGVILTASALSFLGLGAQDPTPDWGLVGGHLSRARDPDHRVRVQPARRRAAGPARPETDFPAMNLEVTNLTVRFGARAVVAVDELALGDAEIVGLAGESGSGKSMTTLAVLGLASTVGATVSG